MGLSQFSARRALLFSKMVDNSVAILWGAKTLTRNGDSDYAFRQDSDFYYLTGFQESGAIALLVKEGASHRFVLFCLPKNIDEECWTGYRLGPVGAVSVLGADEAFPVSELSAKILEYLAHKAAVYSFWGNMQLERKLNTWIGELRHKARKDTLALTHSLDLRPLVHEARLFKSAAEIVQIQKAVDVSIVGHQRAMQRSKAGLSEYHLHAELMHAFADAGLLEVAYYPIVGSGENTCILHYNANRAPLKSGDLVLIDAAAEYQCYAADITRTFPVNGHFTSEQKALYQVVLASQLAGIAAIKPGNRWDDIQKAILNTMVPGLIDLGILQGRVDEVIEQETYRKVYMHGSGHWLGLDVHDAGAYKVDKQWRLLEPNMVLTVEPGIYIRPDEQIPAKWHNLGIRIEDDILVTALGASVLSDALVKHPDDIEAFMA